MQRSPYLIVKEFCDSHNEPQRKNAVTALAALGDSDSLQELVRMGLCDPSDAVRQRVELEVSKLPPAERDQVVDTLSAKLRQPVEESRQAAYYFMGRLRTRGVELPPLNLPIRRRLGLAKSLHKSYYPDRSFKARARGWAASMAVAALTAGVVAIIGALTHHDDPLLYLWASPFVAMALSVLSVQLASPIALHADRVAAACLDLFMVTLAVIPIAAIIVVILAENAADLPVLAAAALMILALTVCTRLFMLAEIGLSGSNSWNRFWGICCGAAAGTLAMSLVPAIFKAQDDTGISNLWFTLLPVAAGLAMAWSQQDASVAAHIRIPFAIRLVGFLPWLAFLVLAGSLISPQTLWREVRVPSSIAVKVRNFPSTISLHTSSDSTVTLTEKASVPGVEWTASVSPHLPLPGLKTAEVKVSYVANAIRVPKLPKGVWDLALECKVCTGQTLLAFAYSNVLFSTPMAVVNLQFEAPAEAQPLGGTR